MEYISAKSADAQRDALRHREVALRVSAAGDMRAFSKKKATTKVAKPFVKWAGGKGQLLEEIRKYYPQGLGTSITKYVEPFIGGGAVLFDIVAKYALKEIHINDINKDLINLYKTIQQDVRSLIVLLQAFQDEYLPLSTEERKAVYAEKRERFNALCPQEHSPDIEKAALLVFLNKTCFNGLYRVNKKGLFNVPIGSYKNPCICDFENLLNVSHRLQGVKIHCGNYFELDSVVDKNTFVYIDPPYRPLNATSSFTSYTEYCFDDDAQKSLAIFATEMQRKGARLLLSNSDPKNHDTDDNFFEKIYDTFDIQRVYASRMINSKSASRGKITELLISNVEGGSNEAWR